MLPILTGSIFFIRKKYTFAIHLGEVSEWSIEHAWKACVLQGTAGSNPALSASKLEPDFSRAFFCL